MSEYIAKASIEPRDYRMVSLYKKHRNPLKDCGICLDGL